MECQFQCDNKKSVEPKKIACYDGVWSRVQIPNCVEPKKCAVISDKNVTDGGVTCSTKNMANGTRCDVECRYKEILFVL